VVLPLAALVWPPLAPAVASGESQVVPALAPASEAQILGLANRVAASARLRRVELLLARPAALAPLSEASLAARLQATER